MRHKRKRTIGDVMTKDVRTIAPDARVTEAALLMRDINVGFVPIVDGGKLTGVITDRDIVVRCVAEGHDPNKCSVSDYMSKEPVFCVPEEDVKAAAKIMEDRGIRRILVHDADGALAGVVSLGDLAVKTRDQKLSGEVVEVVSKPVRGSRRATAGFAGAAEGSGTGAPSGKTLSGLVQDELAAVETYRQALEKVGDEPGGEDIRRIEDDHEEAYALLCNQLAVMGKEPPASSGAWGAWAKAVEGTAKVFGNKAAIKALKEGEEHGIKDYESALSDESVPAPFKKLISAELLPKTRGHIQTLDRLLTGRGGDGNGKSYHSDQGYGESGEGRDVG